MTDTDLTAVRWTDAKIRQLPCTRKTDRGGQAKIRLGGGLILRLSTDRKVYYCQHAQWLLRVGDTNAVRLDDARRLAAAYLVEMRKLLDEWKSASRVERKALDAQVRGDDVDVALAIKTKRTRLTLREALETFLELKRRAGKPGERTLHGYEYNIHRYLGDWLDRPLIEITSEDVVGRYVDLVDGKGLGRRADDGKFTGDGRKGLRGGTPTAGAVMGAFGAIWKFTDHTKRDLGLGTCPTEALNVVFKGWRAPRARDRVIPTDKIRAFWDACIHHENFVQSDLFLFMLFTGLRRGEACGLRWDEVDLDEGVVSIPAERMKRRRPHVFPVVGLALEVLQSRAKEGRDSSGFVFPGDAEGGRADVSKRLLAKVRRAVGVDVSAHDFRRTYTTEALAAGAPMHEVEVLTAHLRGDVTAKHYYAPSIPQLRAAAVRIDAHFNRLIDEAQSDNVVTLSRG